MQSTLKKVPRPRRRAVGPGGTPPGGVPPGGVPPGGIPPGGVPLVGILLAVSVLLLAGCLDLEPMAPAVERPAVSFERSMLDGFEAEVAEARAHYQVPGSVVVVVYGDHPVFSAGLGDRQARASRPLSENTLFRLGTLTRPISTSLLATLVDEQRLDWRSDLPAGLTPALVEGLRRQDDRLEALGASVPAAEGDSVQAGPAAEGDSGQAVPRDSLADLLARTACCRGARWSSDPFGLVALRALEAAGGETSYRRLLQERLIGPAGMVRTAVADRLPALAEDFATPHARTLGGEIEPIDYPAASDVASAGVVSTAADLGRFLSVHIEGGISQTGKRVVSGTNLAASRRPVLVIEAPDSAAPLAESCCGHGGGWSTAELVEGEKWVGAEGGVDGYAGLIGFLPGRRLGLVVLANLDAGHGGRDFAREVRDVFLARLQQRAGSVAHRLDHERTIKSLQRLEGSLGPAGDLSSHLGDYEAGWSLVRDQGAVVLRRGLDQYRLRASAGAHVLIDGAALGTRVVAESEDGRPRLRFRELDGFESVVTRRKNSEQQP